MGRCFGITRSLCRCRKVGPWKFFCHDHSKQPLLGIWVLVFTVAAGIASMQSAWFNRGEEVFLEELISQGYRHYGNHDYDQSGRFFARALKINPTNSDLWLAKSYGHLAMYWNKPMNPGPHLGIEDFESSERTEDLNLQRAYYCAERAVANAQSLFETLRAHTLIGLVVLSMGCECYYHDQTYARIPLPCCNMRQNPFFHFVEAVKSASLLEQRMPPLTQSEWNERMWYGGLAYQGILLILAKTENPWWYRDYLGQRGVKISEPSRESSNRK
jgi:hypothetical protein